MSCLRAAKGTVLGLCVLAALATTNATAGKLRPGVTPLRDQVVCARVCVKGLILNRCEGLISKAVTTSMVMPRQHC